MFGIGGMAAHVLRFAKRARLLRSRAPPLPNPSPTRGEGPKGEHSVADTCDLIVPGSGPGAYVAAIRDAAWLPA